MIVVKGENGSRQGLNAISLSRKYAGYIDFYKNLRNQGEYNLISRKHQPLLKNNSPAEFDSKDITTPRRTHHISVPLVGKDGLNIGSMQIADKYKGSFSEEDEHILLQLAQHVATSIEQMRTEEELRESEARFRTMADAAPVLVWMAGTDGRCNWFNKPWLDFVGRSIEEEARHGWSQNIHPDDSDSYVSTFKEHFGKRKPFKIRYRMRDREGKYSWFLNNGVPLYTPNRIFKGYIGTCIDVTEIEEARRALKNYSETLEKAVQERTAELEESYKKLRLSERMASIGTLSAGLGHDMGNLLLPVRIRLNKLASMDLPDEASVNLKAIQTSTEYLQRLSNGLQLLATDPENAPSTETTSIHSWWEDVHAVLKNALPPGIELKATLPEANYELAIPKTPMTQVVFNLVQNAGEAMKRQKKGLVSLSLSLTGEDCAVLEVSDNGPGMSEEVRNRCMEPFFTTKTRELSTGLGLPLVFGLVHEAGGKVDIQTTPGQGTTFLISIPLISKNDSAQDKVVRQALVLIEDHRIKSLISLELQKLGYKLNKQIPSEPVEILVLDESTANKRPELLYR